MSPLLPILAIAAALLQPTTPPNPPPQPLHPLDALEQPLQRTKGPDGEHTVESDWRSTSLAIATKTTKSGFSVKLTWEGINAPMCVCLTLEDCDADGAPYDFAQPIPYRLRDVAFGTLLAEPSGTATIEFVDVRRMSLDPERVLVTAYGNAAFAITKTAPKDDNGPPRHDPPAVDRMTFDTLELTKDVFTVLAPSPDAAIIAPAARVPKWLQTLPPDHRTRVEGDHRYTHIVSTLARSGEVGDNVPEPHADPAAAPDAMHPLNALAHQLPPNAPSDAEMVSSDQRPTFLALATKTTASGFRVRLTWDGLKPPQSLDLVLEDCTSGGSPYGTSLVHSAQFPRVVLGTLLTEPRGSTTIDFINVRRMSLDPKRVLVTASSNHSPPAPPDAANDAAQPTRAPNVFTVIAPSPDVAIIAPDAQVPDWMKTMPPDHRTHAESANRYLYITSALARSGE